VASFGCWRAAPEAALTTKRSYPHTLVFLAFVTLDSPLVCIRYA